MVDEPPVGASVYRRSILLPAPVETVFRFHANPYNIPKISPGIQTTTIRHANTSAQEGETFEIEVRLLGLLKLRWLGIWREVIPNRLLMDGAQKSPFAYWLHRHEFEPCEDFAQTRMTDCVTYLFPGGWLGRFVGATIGRLQFALMFADRQRRTKRYFEQQK